MVGAALSSRPTSVDDVHRDLFVSVANVGGVGGLGFILHAVGCARDLSFLGHYGPGTAHSCLTAFMNAFQPFGIKYLPVFLFWEASSIFLNIHWALVRQASSRVHIVS